MSIRALSDVRSDALALWEGAAVRTPFAHPTYVDACARTFGFRSVALLADEVGLIGVEKRRGSVRALALPPATTYSSPLLAEWPAEAETVARSTGLDALAGTLARSYAQVTLPLPPDWLDARPFTWNGWTLQTRYTAITDPSDDPTARWSHGTRQRARRFAEEFEVREDAAETTHAARFQVGSYERKGLNAGILVPDLVRLGEAMVGLGLARAFGAYREDRCEAAALFTVDRTRAIYWLSGSEPGPAMAVLFSHALVALAEAGVETVDLGGANVPGVAQFKRQLGGRLAPVVTARWVGPRWLRALHALRP